VFFGGRVYIFHHHCASRERRESRVECRQTWFLCDAPCGGDERRPRREPFFIYIYFTSIEYSIDSRGWCRVSLFLLLLFDFIPRVPLRPSDTLLPRQGASIRTFNLLHWEKGEKSLKDDQEEEEEAAVLSACDLRAQF
jgi:hypothetical protein